jgi:hypothetical protein
MGISSAQPLVHQIRVTLMGNNVRQRAIVHCLIYLVKHVQILVSIIKTHQILLLAYTHVTPSVLLFRFLMEMEIGTVYHLVPLIYLLLIIRNV